MRLLARHCSTENKAGFGRQYGSYPPHTPFFVRVHAFFRPCLRLYQLVFTGFSARVYAFLTA